MTLDPTPLRPDDQVAGGYLYVTLGGQHFELAVLPMRANRQWLATLREAVIRVLKDARKLDDVEDFVELLAGHSEEMMDLLLAYDALGNKTLPERDWIDTTATDRECYDSLKRVTAAAYPFGPDLLRIVPELTPMLMQAAQRGVATATMAMAWSQRTSSAQPSTAGQPTTSKPTSPTSSSRSTSPKRRSAVSKTPSPN